MRLYICPDPKKKFYDRGCECGSMRVGERRAGSSADGESCCVALGRSVSAPCRLGSVGTCASDGRDGRTDAANRAASEAKRCETPAGSLAPREVRGSACISAHYSRRPVPTAKMDAMELAFSEIVV